ncbi:MAG TPA: ABC transporter permease, partial [Gemmatimonadaceae bacterium]|nr:ABC transporter permease [Gemmatimonadaceae bacterium]
MSFQLPFRRARISRDVDDELAFHVTMRTQQLVAAGLSAATAREEALRQFGDLEAVRASCITNDQHKERTMRLRTWLAEFRQDAAYAFRTFGRNRGFAAVVIVSLTLGIGANSAIFTVVDALMLRAIPVQRPAELVIIGDPSRTNSMNEGDAPRTDILSYGMYRDLEAGLKSVQSLAAMGRGGRIDLRVDSTSGVATEHPRARFVSANYFTTLGVGAQRGRVFDGSEDQAVGAAPVVVISDAYWARRFARDPAVVGRTVAINGTAMTIVGVGPSGFDGEVVGQPMDLWMPLAMQPVIVHRDALTPRQTQWLVLMGRLAPGRTVAAVRAEVTPIMRRIYVEKGLDGTPVRAADAAKIDPQVEAGATGLSAVRSILETPLFTLLVGVALLLVIICANVANLLLARSVARGREMSVRLALGAARGRMTRQMITESGVLMLLGGAGGLAFAWLGGRMLVTMANSGGVNVAVDPHFSGPVIGFTLGIALLSVLLFGLVPALQATRVDIASSLRSGARTVSAGMGRGGRPAAGAMLVAAQVALSLVMLVGAAVLVRHLEAISTVDPGLDRDHLIVADVDLARSGLSGPRLDAFLTDMRSRLAAVPGVAAVSYSENGVFSGTESGNTLQIPGFTARASSDSVAAYDNVGPGYATALGAHLIAGRDIADGDAAGRQPVALINEAMARFYFGDRNPIGTPINFDNSHADIVGVIADTHDHTLTAVPRRRFYLAAPQRVLG